MLAMYSRKTSACQCLGKTEAFDMIDSLSTLRPVFHPKRPFSE